MGTTVVNLQILGVPEEAVRAALPHALVGTWSKRFVTACPDRGLRQPERTASSVSKRLKCTLLLTNMFDGDTLCLTVYQNGKRRTAHKSFPSPEGCTVGKPNLFCQALGLPEELAPKLRRLFAESSMQEEKLAILEGLLGAPLFLRWDDTPPDTQVEADTGPLDQWISAHPKAPKIKNRCKVELIQEIPDRGLDYGNDTNMVFLRPTVHKDDDCEDWYTIEHWTGDILGCAMRGGEWCRPLPDGQLELIPLVDPLVPDKLLANTFPEGRSLLHHRIDYKYAFLDWRMVTSAEIIVQNSGDSKVCSPYFSAILHDTATILSPCILTLDGEPACGKLHLLPDGGFLAAIDARYEGSWPPVKIRKATLARYSPDGQQLWAVRDVQYVAGIVDDLIYAVTDYENGQWKDGYLLAISMDGVVKARCLIPFSPCGTTVHIIGSIPYLLEELGYQKDGLLHRLTPDLRPDGEVLVPFTSHFALSPDRSLLYCAGFTSGLQVMDAATLQVLGRLDRPDEFVAPIVDRQNRLWVSRRGYLECYDPELTVISRHRLAGQICDYHFTADGELCVVTFQEKRYLFRVYRVS